MPKSALVIGATGLVGREITRQLLDDPRYDRVTVLVRRLLPLQHPKLHQEILDFDQPDPNLIQGNDLFCAMGTTIAKAGSKAAQYTIDCAYPFEIGKIARQNGTERYLLVSSIGADLHSSAFYLRIKGELEEKIANLAFDTFVAARPSFLLGKREETRIGEKIGIWLALLFRPLIPRRYRAIEGARVARALIEAANNGTTGCVILESEELQGF